jgi:hypothetical protein
MNHAYCIAGMVFLLLTAAAVSRAGMYSDLSTRELYEMRESIRQAGPEEQQAYRQEWWQRWEDMGAEERKRYGPPGEGLPPDAGDSGRGSVPYVIQGKGYEMGPGIIIYRSPSSKAGGNRPGQDDAE